MARPSSLSAKAGRVPPRGLRTLGRRPVAAAVLRTSRRRGVRSELSDFESAPSEWDGLAERSGNVFATWDWLSLWWRHFGVDRPVLAKTYAPSGRLVAILPLYLWRRRPLHVVRLLGHGVGDELGPICAPSDRADAAKALHRVLDELPWRWDVLLAEYLPGTGWDGLVNGQVMRRHASPVLRLHGEDWAGFLAQRSRNFREQVTRKERRLVRHYEVRFRLADDSERLQSDLDTLFRLHRARWSGATTAFGGPHEAFQREFAACALERGWLRLWFLELDGNSVAAWYGFRFAGREFYYQSGRDPRFDDLSVGWVLLAHSIRSAVEDGVSEYRFLRGNDAYKYRFATEDPRLETLALAGTRAGRVAIGAGVATRRLARFPEILRGPLRL
jgi:CelD/BcsL family acetyltransferase involved in cellulose biosynthesis